MRDHYKQHLVFHIHPIPFTAFALGGTDFSLYHLQQLNSHLWFSAGLWGFALEATQPINIFLLINIELSPSDRMLLNPLTPFLTCLSWQPLHCNWINKQSAFGTCHPRRGKVFTKASMLLFTCLATAPFLSLNVRDDGDPEWTSDQRQEFLNQLLE